MRCIPGNRSAFIAVQCSAAAGASIAESLSARLAELWRSHRLPLVFFRAGAAATHDSLHVYRDIVRRLRHAAPDVVVRYYLPLHVWSICALISRASLVLGTSLHVRVVAQVYHRPRVTFAAGGHAPKQAEFVKLWDQPAGGPPLIADERSLAAVARDAIMLAGRAGLSGRDDAERQLSLLHQRYMASFDAWVAPLNCAVRGA